MTVLRSTLAIGAVVGVAGAVLYAAVLSGAVGELGGRLGEDTRSSQYADFFASVPVSDLALGRGPKGTWYWSGFGEYQFFDNGLLWTLFIGGVPTLLGYIAVLIWPALRVARMHPNGPDAASAGLVLLWGIALTGLSTYTLPSLSIGSYLVSLWAGRCHGLLRSGERPWLPAMGNRTGIRSLIAARQRPLGLTER